MRALTRKAFADITRRKGRTTLMIIGILIGVLGLTAVNEASDLIRSTFFYSVDPQGVPTMSSIVDRLPADIEAQIRHLPNVEQVQLRTIYLTHWFPAGQAEPPTMEINGYQDFEHLQLGAFQLTSGRLPGPGEIVMDGSDQGLQPGQPLNIGSTATVETPTGQHVSLRIVGLARTQGLAIWHIPPAPIGYMQASALQQIMQSTRATITNNLPRGTQMMIKAYDPGQAAQTYQTITQILHTANIEPQSFSGIRNTSNDANTQLNMTGLLLIVQLLSLLALILISVMIFSIISALISEQIKIIGTMKALGGTRWPIFKSYLLTISVYGSSGTLLGVGIGLFLGYQLAVNLSKTVQIQVGNFMFPIDVGQFQVAPWVVIVSVCVGIGVPLLAAFWPLWTGTSITVRQALAAYGIQPTNRKRVGWGLQLPWVPQIVWLGLRGLFRKPTRTSLTLFALLLCSSIFLAVQLTNDSLAANIQQLGTSFNSDLRIDLSSSVGDTVETQPVLAALQRLPNVERVEPIDPAEISIQKRILELNGLWAQTQLYHPQIVAGRWLQSNDQNAIIINDSAAARLQLHVGENVPVLIGTQQVRLTIIGIVHDISNVSGSANPTGRLGEAFTTLDTLNRARHLAPDAAERLWLHARDHSAGALQQLQSQVNSTLHTLGFPDGDALLIQQDLQQVSGLQQTIYLLFTIAAIMVALVSLLSLSHALATSVLERRLEIGILRSLGATGWRVSIVFGVEGVTLALLAWGGGMILGPLAATGILQLLGMFTGPIDLAFDPVWLLTTLLFILATALLASIGPALSASQVRIRSILRYE